MNTASGNVGRQRPRSGLAAILFVVIGILSTACVVTVAAQSQPPVPSSPTHLMRFADIAGDWIVFTYEDDLWLVPSRGGDAQRLTDGPGVETRAKFSPDGRWIAFSGEYDGGSDVYVMPAGGGEPRRLTYHPSGDRVLGWAPDGSQVLFSSARTNPLGALELFVVPVDGGMPRRLPVDRGGLAAYAPDGKQLVYNRIPREQRTWKRYRGGMAQDLWLADFTLGSIDRLTDFPGTDNYPMWEAEGLFFTSDREDGTLNIYRIDPATRSTTRLTRYRDYDVKEPSSGPGAIVYRQAEQLHVLDLASGRIDDIEVRIPSDRATVRKELVGIAPTIGSFGLSPAGERMVLEARGEILSLPAEHGEPLHLTATSASREKNAAWSPDGRWICFDSDRTGEEELYLVDHKGGAWRQLTHQSGGLLLQPVWSPDSKYILFGDKFMRLNLLEVASGKVTVIDRGQFDDAWERWGILDYVWSPDSRWVAYSKNNANMNETIQLYSLQSGKITPVTDDLFTSWSPSFDPEGRYLWFLSNRTFDPIMGRLDQNHVFLKMARPYLVLLQKDVRSPFLEKNDEVAIVGEDGKGERSKKGSASGEGKSSAAVAPVSIDIDGIATRAVAVEGIEAGNYFRLEATSDGCFLLRRNEPVFIKYQNVDDRTADELDLVAYDLEKQETEDRMSGIANYHLSRDQSKLVYRAGDRYGIVATDTTAKVGDGEVSLDDVRIRLDPRAEFAQMFREAWRIERDWFYDPGMHGVDWSKIYEKYAPFVSECGTRGDLNYLIGEMIAELNIGHTYVSGGDLEPGAEPASVGMLGCEFVTESGAGYHRIVRIVPGLAWDPAARSPLTEPGVGVHEGSYLIAIDGEEVPAGDNVYAHLQDKAGRVVELTVNDRPQAGGARTLRVETLRGEFSLRYRAWVEENRRRVDELSGGRIAYLHLPDMSVAGLREFGRYYYAQALKGGFLLDDRDNHGGFVSGMIIDRLERELWGITKPREGGVAREPERAFHGPMVVLINETTGSNGEFFAEAIKLKGLATLMGLRTWGGAIGIEPHEDLVDGGAVTAPQFGLYGLDGRWLIEGRGVEPDVEVPNAPAAVVAGRDPQLEAGVQQLLEQLRTDGSRWAIPPIPAFPDKSKPGEGMRR